MNKYERGLFDDAERVIRDMGNILIDLTDRPEYLDILGRAAFVSGQIKGWLHAEKATDDG